MEALYNKYSGVSIDDVGSQLLALPLPAWLLSSHIKTLFSDPDAWNSAVAEEELSMAPGLESVLSSSSPPSLDFFKNLPQPSDSQRQWGVYALLLERYGSKAKLYIGSGTDALDRIQRRARNYDSGRGPFSQLTQEALNDGYTVSSFGMLCWIDLPSSVQVLRQRARMLVLEAVFAIAFNACRKTIADELYIDDFHLWQRQDVEWDPLCTHLSLCEKVAANVHLSDEELKLVAAHRKERIVQKTQRYRKRKREADEVSYLQENLDSHQAWSERNPGRVNEIAAGVRKKAKDSGRFRCDPCDHNAATQFALDEHLKSISHAAAVKNGGKAIKEPSTAALKKREQRALARASKQHYCSTCDKACQDANKLNQHLNSPGHDKAVKALANN